MARYIIFGAGAVGGVIGARLHTAGHDVTLIARGAHREAMARDGLKLRTSSEDENIRIPVAADISEVAIGADDTVILTLKTQDAALILQDLAAVAHPRAAIVCALNGVESERLASRLFANVYGCYLYISAAQIDPGVVRLYNAPCFGILDLGRYPTGTDARGATIAADLEAAGFASLQRDDIMFWKRGKLVLNTGNAINAACPDLAEAKDIVTMTLEETRRCMAAAGLAFASAEQVFERAKALTSTTIDGKGFPGSSTFQSLARGNPTTEADYLNGEIVLLGHLTGVATPANTTLQALVRRMAREHIAPGAISADELRALIAANSHG